MRERSAPGYEEPRPSFANDAEPDRRAARDHSGGGFSLFGWRKPSAPAPETPATDFAEFGDEEDLPPSHSREDQTRDPALDEELEIPAFLRRQMHPR